MSLPSSVIQIIFLHIMIFRHFQKPIFGVCFPDCLCAGVGLSLLPPPLRALGHHHRGVSDGRGQVCGGARPLYHGILNAGIDNESALRVSHRLYHGPRAEPKQPHPEGAVQEHG